MGELRLEWIDPKTLTPNPANWRRHPKAQKDALEAVIGEAGWAGALLFNERTNRLIDGHLRQEISHDGPVPVLVGSWTEDQERLILATLDPIAALAEAESTALDALLKTVETESEAVRALLAGLAEQEGIDLGGEPVADPGAQVDKAAELQEKWRVETGDLFIIGEHRLACGDCTDGAVVERVMGGERAQLVWTDPPYGVKYGDKLEAANPMGYQVRKIENDDLPPGELEEFLRAAFSLAARHCAVGAAIYAACPAGTPLPTAIAAFTDSGFDFRWQLVWVKDQLVLSRADYHFRHENILYGWKSDGGHYFTNDRTQDSVFEIARPKASPEHPTMKPVELVTTLIGNSSRKSEIVFDPFLGSGTTAVACEQLHRRCFGIEIELKYCAVTLERLSQMGLEPRRVE